MIFSAYFLQSQNKSRCYDQNPSAISQQLQISKKASHLLRTVWTLAWCNPYLPWSDLTWADLIWHDLICSDWVLLTLPTFLQSAFGFKCHQSHRKPFTLKILSPSPGDAICQIPFRFQPKPYLSQILPIFPISWFGTSLPACIFWKVLYQSA